MILNTIQNRILRDPAADKDEGGGDNSDKSNQLTEAQKAAIEKARLEERARVREQLEEAERKQQNQADELAKLRKEFDQVSAALKAVDTTKAGAGSDPIDLPKLIAEVSQKSAEQTRKDLQAQIESLTAEVSANRLAELKRTLVQEAGGPSKLVMAMVGGRTEEELRKSIELSKKAFAEVTAAVLKKKTSQQDGTEADDDTANEDGDATADEDREESDDAENASSPAVGPGSTQQQRTSRNKDGVLSQVGQLSMTDYAKNRRKILDTVARRFGNPNVVIRPH